MKIDMTKGPVWKQILIFSLPIIAGNLLQQLYNTVDGIIVGHIIGEDAFSGVTTCVPLTYLFTAFSIGLSIGAGVVVSQYFGAGKHKEIPVCIDTALILLGVFGLFITAVAEIFAGVLLEVVLGIPDSVMPFALPYYRIFCLGLFFQFIYNAIAAILRGFGDSKAVLMFLVIATLLNTVLDLLFVGPLNMNISGAAAATIIAQAVSAVISYIYMRKRFPYVKSIRHWDRKISFTMTRIGLPIAIQQSLVAVGQGSMQRLVNSFGDTVNGIVAAYGAGYKISYIIYAPAQGFQSGLASFAGQNIGAGEIRRAKQGLRATMIMSTAALVALSALLLIFATPVMSLFGLTGDAVEIGVRQIRFLSLFFWLVSVYLSFSGLLQGAGDTIILSIATLFSYFARVVAGYLAVYFGVLSYDAAWVTYPLVWALAFIINGARYFTGAWKKKAVAGKLSQNQQ